MNIIELYKQVFNEDGTVKQCGREKCKKLIRMCQNLNKDIDFGSIESGMMNVENIKKFIETLRKSWKIV